MDAQTWTVLLLRILIVGIVQQIYQIISITLMVQLWIYQTVPQMQIILNQPKNIIGINCKSSHKKLGEVSSASPFLFFNAF